MPVYRHEVKHAIPPQEVPLLRRRLAAALPPDPHGAQGVYAVRSLYFDSPEDKALREKLDGVNEREKFRLRLYDGDASLILLEKKAKRGGLGCKTQAPLTVGEVRALLGGDTAWMAQSPAPLVRELYAKMHAQGLRPRTLVDYTRAAFVYGPGDVRVTLDSDIRTGLRSLAFLDPAAPTVPAPDAGAVLEIKWGAFLPDLVRALAGVPGCRAAAFSKYAACRRYD